LLLVALLLSRENQKACNFLHPHGVFPRTASCSINKNKFMAILSLTACHRQIRLRKKDAAQVLLTSANNCMPSTKDMFASTRRQL